MEFATKESVVPIPEINALIAIIEDMNEPEIDELISLVAQLKR